MVALIYAQIHSHALEYKESLQEFKKKINKHERV